MKYTFTQPLFRWAVMRGDGATLKHLLLDKDVPAITAEINAKDENKKTFLWLAAEN